MKKQLLSILLVAACAVGCASTADNALISVEATQRGFMLKTPVADLTTMTSVIVCVPPFRDKHFYNVGDDVKLINTPNRAEIVQLGSKKVVDIVEYSAEVAGNSAVLTLKADLFHADPTDLENTLLVAPEYLLRDSRYTATLADGTQIFGAVPPTFEGEIEVRHVFEDAVKCSFTNSFGTFELEVLEGPPFIIGDRRGVVFEERRCFWIGHLEPLTQEERYTSVVKVTYTPAVDLADLSPAPIAPDTVVEAVKQAEAEVDFEFDLPLYPAPKAVQFTDGFFAPATISVSSNATDARLEKAYSRVLFDTLGFARGNTANIEVIIGDEGEGILVPPENPEGYLLEVTPEGIKIFSRSEHGAFYAFQTLRALHRNGKFKNALIRDWPDMDIRAVHFMLPDRDALSLLTRMVTEVMVPMKMNMFIMECEFVHWEVIPDLHVFWGMTKEDCEALIALCEENFIEPIPLLQTLSHMPWMFQHGKNMEMCEDPRNPYAYFTGHPGVYPFMTKVLDEVMETFKNPRYIHIGHDELYTWSAYPNRPESRAIGTPKLVLDDVMWYYNYAKERNSKIMMWHDIFVTPAESPENGHGGGAPDWVDTIRPDLPRDILFCVWRYAGKTQEFLDVNHLAAEGFEIAGSSWFEINNIERLTKATNTAGGEGMISTTWIYPVVENGVIIDGCHNALEKWFIQLAPYVRSGSWSWTVSDYNNRNLDGKVLFASLLEGGRNRGVKAGWALDLNKVANIDLAPGAFLTNELFGFDTALSPGNSRIGRMLFNIPGSGDTVRMVALKSRLTPNFPAEVVINTGELKCSELAFLHTAPGIQPAPKDTVATYTLTYADGTSAELNVRYQFEIAPPEEDVNYLLSTGNRVAWRYGTQKMSMFYALYANPHPEKAIRSITINNTEAANPFYVFGITALK